MASRNQKNSNVRSVISSLCALLFVYLLYNPEFFVRENLVARSPKWISGNYPDLERNAFTGRVLMGKSATDLVGSGVNSSRLVVDDSSGMKKNVMMEKPSICLGLKEHHKYANPCEFLRSNSHCASGGYFDYLTFFYCKCDGARALGYMVLGVWLLALLYMLGNTTADYFCLQLFLAFLCFLLAMAHWMFLRVLLHLWAQVPMMWGLIACWEVSFSLLVLLSVLYHSVFLDKSLRLTVSVLSGMSASSLLLLFLLV